MTFSKFALRALSYLVPAQRADWLREWEAELTYAWHSSQFRGPTNELLEPTGRRHKQAPSRVVRLTIALRCFGALEDAFWLRMRRRDNTMVLQDIRYAVRTLGKNPLFTAVVLLTLALGIGANTAIFTLVDAVLLRPLPVAHPEELADVYTTCRRGFPWCTSSYPDFIDYRDRSTTFADMAAFGGTQLSVDDGESANVAGGMFVTGDYFTMLGVNALHGRTILPDDDRVGDPRPVILLSHRMWMSEFAGDEDIVGRDLRLNGSPFTVVGVAPKRFRGTRLSSDPDLWIPFSSQPLVLGGPGTTAAGAARPSVFENRGTRRFAIIGRRKPGVTRDQARAEMAALSDRMQEENAGARGGRGGRSITIEATRTYALPAAQTGEDIVRFVTLLLTVVAASLLIACANIANLMLSRASARRREIGMRIALGADRGRLVKQLITESLVLSVAGAVAGLFVASMALKFLSGYALARVPLDRFVGFATRRTGPRIHGRHRDTDRIAFRCRSGHTDDQPQPHHCPQRTVSGPALSRNREDTQRSARGSDGACPRSPDRCGTLSSEPQAGAGCRCGVRNPTPGHGDLRPLDAQLHPRTSHPIRDRSERTRRGIAYCTPGKQFRISTTHSKRCRVLHPYRWVRRSRGRRTAYRSELGRPRVFRYNGYSGDRPRHHEAGSSRGSTGRRHQRNDGATMVERPRPRGPLLSYVPGRQWPGSVDCRRRPARRARDLAHLPDVRAYPLAFTPGTRGRIVEQAVIADVRSPNDLDKYRGRLQNAIVLATPPMPTSPRFVQDAFRHTEESLHTFETEGRDLLIQRHARGQPEQRTFRPEGISELDVEQFFKSEGVAVVLKARGRTARIPVPAGSDWLSRPDAPFQHGHVRQAPAPGSDDQRKCGGELRLPRRHAGRTVAAAKINGE